MSFNGSGTYVPPAGQPVATNTVISSAVFNTLVTDLGNSLTNTLPRDGQASMSGQLKIIDGTSSVPGIAFNSEAASGIFRPASGMLALTVSGVEGLRLNSSGRVLIGSTTDDATNKLQVTGPVKITGALTATSFVGPVTGAVTGNVTGTAANVTGTVAIANGGTGAVTGAAAVVALGAVQNGGGVGQGTNLVKLGWGTGGGLKATVDSTDLGYLPFSGTNTVSGGMITFGNPLTVQTLNTSGTATIAGNLSVGAGATFASGITVAGGTTLNSTLTVGTGVTSNINGPLLSTAGATMSNGLAITNGAFTSAVPVQAQGGAPVALASGNGFVQAGGTAGQNLVLDYTAIQARNNGAANTLSLNYYGGQINMGGAAATLLNVTGSQQTSGTITATGSLTTNDILYCRYSGNLKIALCDSATTRGYISADSGNAFRVINAANSTYVFSVDNSGNGSFNASLSVSNGTVTAAQLQLTNGNPTSRYTNTTSGGSRAMYLDNNNAFCWPSTDSVLRMYHTDAGQIVATTITQSSDERLKEKWADVKPTFLSDLANVKHGTYKLIDPSSTQRHIGVSAQSLEAVIPEAVFEGNKGYLAVNYGNAALVASIKLAREVLTLKSELRALTAVVSRLVGAKQ